MFGAALVGRCGTPLQRSRLRHRLGCGRDDEDNGSEAPGAQGGLATEMREVIPASPFASVASISDFADFTELFRGLGSTAAVYDRAGDHAGGIWAYLSYQVDGRKLLNALVCPE